MGTHLGPLPFPFVSSSPSFLLRRFRRLVYAHIPRRGARVEVDWAVRVRGVVLRRRFGRFRGCRPPFAFAFVSAGRRRGQEGRGGSLAFGIGFVGVGRFAFVVVTLAFSSSLRAVTWRSCRYLAYAVSELEGWRRGGTYHRRGCPGACSLGRRHSKGLACGWAIRCVRGHFGWRWRECGGHGVSMGGGSGSGGGGKGRDDVATVEPRLLELARHGPRAARVGYISFIIFSNKATMAQLVGALPRSYVAWGSIHASCKFFFSLLYNKDTINTIRILFNSFYYCLYVF